MRVRVLGSGAGGGFPQWNCNCPQCRGLRAGTLHAAARTQSAIAVSADDRRWYLVNAGPDVRQQIAGFDALSPQSSPRHSPIHAVLLTNAEVDHIAGLLTLRESQPLTLYATEQVRGWIMDGNSVFRAVCGPPRCAWKSVHLGSDPNDLHDLIGVDDLPSGIRYQAFCVPGRAPAYLVGKVDDWSQASIGYRFTEADSGRSLVYLPGVREVDDEVKDRLRGCDVFFIDGTCWTDDEMIGVGLAQKTSFSMGHVPISGPNGSLARLADLAGVRKIYTHLNNTNPLLVEDSAERRAAQAAGWEIAFDGMDFRV